MPKVTGRIEVLVNGKLLLNKAGAIARGIGESGKPATERKPVMGDNGIVGFVDETIPVECETTIVDRDDVSLSEIAAVNGDSTVIYRSAGGGKVYTMPNATCVKNFEVTGGEGETSVKFVGTTWIEGTQ